MISLGKLIDTTWDFYRAHFGHLIKLSAWLLLIPAIKILGLLIYPDAEALVATDGLSFGHSAGVLLFGFGNYIVTPLVGLVVLGATVLFMNKQLSRRGRDVKGSLKESLSLLAPAIIVSCLLILVVLAATLVGTGPSLLLALIGSFTGNGTLVILSNLLLILGLIVALILTILWSLQYLFAPYVLYIEGTTGFRALSRSYQLVKGNFWPVLLRVALPKILFISVGLILLTVAYNVFFLMMQFTPAMDASVQAKILNSALAFIPIVIALFLNPLIIIADVVLFKELALTQKS